MNINPNDEAAADIDAKDAELKAALPKAEAAVPATVTTSTPATPRAGAVAVGARPDQDKTYQLLRDELSYEANLITLRTSWFVASQAFFFTSLAIALNRSPNVTFALENSVLFPLVPWVSLIVCGATFLAVLSGICSANKVRAKIKELAPNNQLAAQFPQRGFLIITGGLLPSFGLPVVFAICWIMILRKCV